MRPRCDRAARSCRRVRGSRRCRQFRAATVTILRDHRPHNRPPGCRTGNQAARTLRPLRGRVRSAHSRQRCTRTSPPCSSGRTGSTTRPECFDSSKSFALPRGLSITRVRGAGRACFGHARTDRFQALTLGGPGHVRRTRSPGTGIWPATHSRERVRSAVTRAPDSSTDPRHPAEVVVQDAGGSAAARPPAL